MKERYIICNIRTPRNIYGNRLGKDYIDHVYSGGDYEFVKKKEFNKAIKFKSKSYAEKISDKINYDCELGGTENYVCVITLSSVGKDIDFG